MKDAIINEFESVYGKQNDIRVFFAPGRVNLIGEHTDYNGGHVFPCALTIGTYGAVVKRNDRIIRMYSGNFKENGVVECSLDDADFEKKGDWTVYVRAVILAFGTEGFYPDSGFDLYVQGTIPNGSGLSSSASLEVLVSKILIELFGFKVDMIRASLLSQLAENRYVGVNCGIMDQFAIAMGKRDHAIFLETGNLHYEYVPISLSGYRIVIGNTNKKRGLSDSKYNERRAECEHALMQLQKVINIKSLCELGLQTFAANEGAIGEEVERKRARHAVTENVRTVQACEALRSRDLKTFGRLMNESHASLKDDYEVTGKELDTLVEVAGRQKGVLGSRMTGAGFGGCTVSIVKDDCVDEFTQNVGREYLERIGYEASFYVVDVGDGPREL